MKTLSPGRHLTRLFFLAFVLGIFTAPVIHAGLSVEMNVIRYDEQGYYFYAALTTNTTPPNVSYGDYYIASAGIPNSGSSGLYHFDTNGFNQNDGISWGYSDFDSMKQQLTNDTWTLAITNATTTNVYHFSVTANIASNSLPLVTITFPVNGAVNVTNQPNFTWQGPTNFASLTLYDYNASEIVPVTQTNWPAPQVLYEGKNSFTVHYDTNPPTAVVASMPLDAASNSIASWVSTSHLQDYLSSEFIVGKPDPSGTVHTLVAHYSWDATNSDGTASGADSSGHGYDMNFGGGSGAQGGNNSIDVAAAGPRAIQFHNGDGNSAGYVGWTATPPALLSALAGSFSVSCWIKTTNTIAWDDAPAYYGAGIVSADNGGQANDLIPLALTGSKIGFNTGGDSDVTMNSTAPVNDGNYHHVVVTRNQVTGQKIIYIDGVLDSFSSGTRNLLNDPQKLTIGALANAGNSDVNDNSYYNGFDGEVDDLQIYSGVLSAGEVAGLYASPGVTVPNGGGLFGGHKNVAHYAFDDSNNLGQDSSGHGNDLSGPLTWGPQYQFATDAEAGGGAIQFFGTSALFASGQALVNLNAVLAGSFTFSAWVKTTVTNGADGNNAFFGAAIFWAYNDQGNTNDTIPLSITGNKGAFTTRDHAGLNNTLHSTTSVNDGSYHLLTVTRDQTSGEKKIYVDGNFENSEIGTSDRLNGNNYNLTIGGYAYDLGGTNFSSYNGLLDDVQIYTGVLSDTDVADLFAHPGTTIPDVAGSSGGPVAHYGFDEGTVLAGDVSGNNNPVVHAGNFNGNGPAISNDAKTGAGSVSFDGGSYLTASSNLLATLAGDFTISLWLKTGQSFGNQNDFAWQGAGIIAADSPNGGAKDLIPVALTGGQVAFNVGDGSSDNTLNSSAAVNDNNWHHVVVTRSQATGERQIFIDGTFDSSKGGTTGLLNDPLLLTIGAKADASDPDPASPDFTGSNGYEGLLDDVQIYDRVLSSDEVAFLYQNPGGTISGSQFDNALNTSGLTWTTGGDANWFVESSNTHDGISAVQSGPVADNQKSRLETMVPTAGQISFYWKVSSEDGSDFLHFYINGNEQDSISGEADWTQQTYSVSAGDTLRWEYTKDGSGHDGLDAGFLDQVTYTPNNSVNFNAALGTTNLNWTVGGSSHWFLEATNTHDGYLAAQNGPMTNGQNSTLQTTVTGPGTLGFWFWSKVSDLYFNGFYLSFALDGNDQSLYSGYYDGGWRQDAGINIPPGTHTLVWTAHGGYSPNAVGFLDEVSLSGDYIPTITSGPVDGTVPGAGYNSTIPVKFGSNIVLVVQLNGNPAPTVRWYHSGTLLTNATSATLTITNSQFTDAGYYQLQASNYLGVVGSSYIYVKVYKDTDLQPLSLTAPAVISSSSIARFAWTVNNAGPAAVSNFTDYLTFAAPVVTPFYTIGSLWGVYNSTSIPPASVYSVSNSTQRFPSVPAGTYSVVLRVDSNNDIIETNENNNLFTNFFVTVINPDLQPGNLHVASTTNLGSATIQFTYNLTNNGPGILDGAGFYDALFLSTNATFDSSAIFLQQINQSPSIAAGSFVTTTNSFALPVVPSGDYYLILHTDHYGFQGVGYIWEGNESNNYASVAIHIQQSDLVPTNLVAPLLVSSRQPVPVSWQDLNQGDGLATNLAYNLQYDDLYLSTNQSANASSIKLGNYYSSDFAGQNYYQGEDYYWNTGLAAGQSFTNLHNIIIPNVPAGNYFLVLSVDANNAIREISESNNTLAVPITLGTLDLMPTAFTVPAAANTRSTIPVTWAVTNKGNGTVYPAWADRVFISTNSTLDNHATLLGEFPQNFVLAGGASYSVSNSITLNGVGAGNYYLLLSIDAATNVMEINHSNNVAVLPITINSPDLVATALIAGPVFSSQQPVSAVYSVSNASSTVTAYAGWSDRLYLSPDGIIESNNLPFIFGYEYYSGQPVIDVVQSGNLAPNTGYSQLLNSSIPAVPAGDYFFLLQANANQFFAENNTLNNLLARPVHVNNPDLELTNFAAPASIVLTQYSQQFEADWSVKNRGAGDAYAGWSDYLYLSRTNIMDNTAVYIGSAGQNPVLASGQSYLSFLNAGLPDGIQGNYFLLLQANDSRSLYESTYTNNLAVRPVSLIVPPVPVLSVTAVDSPADAWSGQQIYITWTLTNSGTAAVSGTFYDNVYLCSSAAGAGPQLYGSYPFTGQIQPGQSIVRQQKIYLPINLQGTFWVAAQTDVGHNIFEFTYRTNEFLVASHPLEVHLTPTPNLAIASLAAPTNMFSGGEGTVSWVETNSGSGPTSAPFWDDAVYLCDTTNFYTASYRVLLSAPNNVAYLNPGNSYASSANITLPRGITGTFYFIVWADAGNNVFEGTNETDNLSTSLPVFVQPALTPDLQVVTVQPPHDAFSGQAVSVKYAETNFGLGQTQPSEVQWSDRVYISTNVTLDSSATYLGDIVHNGGLTPSAGYAGTNSLTLPIGISGDWYFIIQGDIFNQVYEAAFEDNNARTAAYVTHIALTPPPDLETFITQSPVNALSSHLLAVTYTVANNGTTITPNSGWNDNLYLGTNSIFDPSHALYLTTSSHYGPLPPGASYTNTFYVVLPADLLGTNYIFVRSDAYNAVFELDKTNNLARATNPVVVNFLPSDLAVTSLTAPGLCNAGSGILVSWAVTNLGVGDTAVGSWNDRLILSQNILPGAPSDVQLVQVTHNGLVPANGSYTVNNQLAQVPSYVAAGNYQLFLIADANHDVPVETNWINNVYGPVPITITAHSPDLQIVSANGPLNALSGSTVTVSWTEKNAGDLPANSSYWYDTLYLSPDGLLGPSAIQLGYQQNPGPLLSGQSYTNSLSVALPVNVQSNYYFVVVADGYNYIPEAGAENNNSYVINPPVFITLSPVPDLAVTSVSTPATAFAGQNFHLSWVVKNVGSTNATSAWYDVAYLSADQILDANLDTYLGYAYQNHDLAPGDSYTNSADFPIPQGLAGPFYVFVTTDPGHSINERGQLTNNTAYNPQAMQVQLLPPVDLVAGQVTIPVNAVPGQNMTVSYTVQNQGSNTAVGSWVDSLFVSVDTNWDVGDKFFARVTHTGDVLPGGSYTGTVTAALPGVLPGDYHIIIRSDILNHLTEANKSNNIAASLNSASVDVQRLTLGTPAENTLGLGQSAFYKFDATNGQTIHLQFSSTATLSDNELFVKCGDMPDSGNFDVAANDPFIANPEIYFAATNTGTYYVLVKCNYAAAPTPYTVLAEVLPFTVREVQPNMSGNVGNTTFFIRGALFDKQTQFTLQQADRTIESQSVYLGDSTAAYVTFNMNGAPDGNWNFQATMIDTASNAITTTLSNAVFVGSADPVEPDVSIDGPLAVREPSMGYTTHSCLVDYGNSGYSDLAPPLILVQSEEGTTLGTTLNNLQTKTIQLLGRSLVGPPEILRPQTQASKIIYYRGGGTHLEVWTLAADSTRALTDTDWADIENSVRPSGITDADWLNFWVNIRPRLGSTWGDYVQFLDRVATNFPAEQRVVSEMFFSLYTNAPGFKASAAMTGRLLGAVDGLPQSNVELDLMTLSSNSYAGTVAARAQTDPSGNFTFPYLPPGHYYYAVSDSYFDMDRDGQPDTNLAGFVMTSTDLMNQVVYLHQPVTNALVTVTNDENATLTLDGEGVLHSFWYRDGALWHSWNKNGQWLDARMICTNLIGSFAVGAGPHLLDGSHAGLIIAWSQSTSNNVELFYAIGRSSTAGGYDWSQPVMLTSDLLAQNTSPAIAVRNDGLAVITYLKRASQSQDDTDVYYSLVNVSSGNLVWRDLASPSPLLSYELPKAATTADPTSISYPFEKKWSSSGIGGEDITFAASLLIKGGVSGCGATASATATLGVTTATPENSLNVNGSVAGNFAWQINPEQCGWEFKSATFDVNGSIHYDIKNGAATMLRAIPHPAPKVIATALDEMQDFLRARGILLENTVGFGMGLSLNGLGWTHAPAPLTQWREPDSWGRTLLTLDANIVIGVRGLGENEELVKSVQVTDFSFWHPEEVKTSSTFEQQGTNGPGSFFSAEGSAKIQAVFELYPSLHLRSLTPSGLFKVSFSPYYNFTYPLTFDPIVIDHNQPVPRDGSGTDTLPAGWTFNYDPAPFIGSTNVYGTNAVLSNVASDIYQDNQPCLAVDAGNVPFQVWSKFGNPYAVHPGSQVYVADFNGINWNPPVIISNSLGFNSSVRAGIDSLGQRVAVWAHGDSSALTTNLTYAQFNAIRSSNNVCFSVFDGSSWSAPEQVAATTGMDTDVQLSRMENGDLLAVWIYTDNTGTQHLVSSRWDGKGWDSLTEIISGQVSAPSAQQTAGITRLFWTQEINTNHDRNIYWSQNTGGSWTAPAQFNPMLLAPSPSAVESKDVPVASLLAIQQVLETQRKACCKCDKGVKNQDVTPNVGCGIASIDYNYETCHRIFTYKACQVRPTDPNNIVGPEGYGPERWVPAATPLDYTIQFENDPALASAPATRVTITLPLDDQFDPRTFRLGDFGFGGLIFNIPPGSAFYQTRLDLSATKGYFVDLIAGVDIVNRQAFWTLTTIDPATGDVPRNALIGFLPPNNTPPEGDGFVSCAITPKIGVTNGAPVAAKATIVFDNQPPMDTPTALNKLQTGHPTSSVLPLPAVTVNPTFDVTWQGAAIAGGSGVSSYDIYASENGSIYYPWLQGVTFNHAPFAGQPGGTYAFYSIAHDNVGNVQAAPTNADAVTFVSSNLPPMIGTITNLSAAPDTTVSVKIRATDPNGDQLVYSLVSAPPGAIIGATNGIFRWRATRAFADSTNSVTVTVTDNGVPPLTTNATFTITIQDFLELTLGETNLEGGHAASIPISLASNSGATNVLFTVQVPEDLLTNWTLAATAPAIGAAALQDFVTNILVTLNTATGQSLQGTQQISTLTFSAVTNKVSGFITLPVTSISATKPNGGIYANYVTHSGSVIVVQNEPLIRARIGTNQSRSLQLYGKIGTDYQVLFNTNLTAPNGWQSLLTYTQTNGVITLPLNSSNPVIFYRLLGP